MGLKRPRYPNLDPENTAIENTATKTISANTKGKHVRTVGKGGICL